VAGDWDGGRQPAPLNSRPPAVRMSVLTEGKRPVRVHRDLPAVPVRRCLFMPRGGPGDTA